VNALTGADAAGRVRAAIAGKLHVSASHHLDKVVGRQP